MYLCLNKLASKVWKKKCTNFLYTMCKGGRKLELFFHSFLAIFPSLMMQPISLFITKTGLFFNKSANALLANIIHDPSSEYNWWKSEHTSVNGAGESGDNLRPQWGV